MNHSGGDRPNDKGLPADACERMHLRFESSLVNVDHAAAAIRSWCQVNEVAPAIAGQIELVLVEAVTNVIVHAYDKLAGQPIDVSWWRDGRRLLIEMRDRGQPIATVPEGILPDPDAESGRGWYIIRSLADSVDYRREHQENVLVLCKDLVAP